MCYYCVSMIMFIFCITTHFPLCIKSVWTSPLSSLSSLVHAFVGSPKNTARFKNKKKTKTISGEVHRGFWICERTLRDLEAIFWASSSLFNLECENGACFLCLEKNVQRYWWMLLNEDLTSSVWRRPVVRLPKKWVASLRFSLHPTYFISSPYFDCIPVC